MSVILLYAEDDSEHRMMMRLIIKETNATLVGAANGREAIQKIQEQQPDLVLLDLFMPELDGFGVMEALKSNPETKHIPIIIVSACLDAENRKQARQAGALDFIAKPYDPIELIKLVDRHLTGRVNPVSPRLKESKLSFS